MGEVYRRLRLRGDPAAPAHGETTSDALRRHRPSARPDAPSTAGLIPSPVYRGRDPRLGREVAIKVLPAALSDDPGRLRRFEREAKAVSALNHPNILTIHDIGTSEGKPYVVTELLEGETLRARLAGGPLPAACAVELATELAHGLGAAHEKGIVHRDIKPENLFATAQGHLKVELVPAKDQPGAGGGRASAKAYELYLQGRFQLSLDTTLSSVNAAIERFEQALALDPDFVFAQLGLADAFARMDFSIDPEGGWFDRAEAMCRRALTIAPELPEGHYLRARLLWHPRSGWDGPGAVREFSAAIAGRPSLNEAHHFRAQVFNHLGLLEEAVAGFDRALAIDPGDEYARVHRPLSRYLQGRYGEALEAMRPLASANPTAWSLYTTALCQLRLSRIGDAAATIERLARQFAGNVLLFAGKALLAALQGEPDRAQEQIALVDRNRKLYGHYHHAQYDAGCAEALLGDKNAAIDWLTAAAENGFPCAPVFSSDRWLEPLRGEPRFVSLLAELQRKGELYRSLVP
ncbi:MAG TPA: tetratricopeptide repeat protein [Thermoanaerobaculia bacterium]|nr:tetratricopeptide repeat protein [Thermoanaerobaculia bacterium]